MNQGARGKGSEAGQQRWHCVHHDVFLPTGPWNSFAVRSRPRPPIRIRLPAGAVTFLWSAILFVTGGARSIAFQGAITTSPTGSRPAIDDDADRATARSAADPASPGALGPVARLLPRCLSRTVAQQGGLQPVEAASDASGHDGCPFASSGSTMRIATSPMSSTP